MNQTKLETAIGLGYVNDRQVRLLRVVVEQVVRYNRLAGVSGDGGYLLRL